MRLPALISAARRVAGSFGPVLEGWAALSTALVTIGYAGLAGHMPVDIEYWREELGWFGRNFAYWTVFVVLGTAGLFALMPISLYLRLRESSVGKADAED